MEQGSGGILARLAERIFCRIQCFAIHTPRPRRKAYAAYIDAYRKETRHIRPIWGIDRNDREAHLALYRKGSVLLADLLVRVGEEPFFNFLAGVIQAHITDTSAFLDFAESRLGRKNRDWIEKRLKE